MKYSFLTSSYLFLSIALSLNCSAQNLEVAKKSINIYQSPSIQRSIIAEGGGFFPILNQLGDNLFTVYRTGAGHLGKNGALSYSISDVTGINWSAAQDIVNSSMDDRNPAVAVLPGNRIVVGYHEQSSYKEDGAYNPTLKQSRCMITWSDDLGVTWSPPQPLGIPGMESCSPYGRIIRLQDGTLLMNVYGAYTKKVPLMENQRSSYRSYAYLVRSKDNGETWDDPSLILPNHNETAIFLLPDNTLLAASRDGAGMQRLDSCISKDMGRTWSSPLRITGQKQHPADLLQLSNGWLLLLYGDRSGTDNRVIRGVISRNNGRTWDISYDIVFSRSVRGDFGYPSGLLLPNGNLAITYYSAGAAKNAYDGTQAKALLVQCKEADLIEAYSDLIKKK
jgi:BNR repeat protein